MTHPTPAKKLLDQVSEALRLKHYSIHTEESYLAWIKRYILFHHKRHPQDMGGPEIQAFLSHLALHENIASSTVRLSSRRSPKPGPQRPPFPLP